MFSIQMYAQSTFQKVYQISNFHHFTESVQQTADGGFIFQGWRTEVTNLPLMRMELIKTDAQGVITWKKGYGKCLLYNSFTGCIGGEDPSTSTMGGCVQQTQDQGYIMTGSLGDKMVLIKTNSTGAVTWAKTYGSGSYGKYVRQTSEGGYICVGYSGNNIFIVKTTSNGTLSWDRAYHISTNYNDAATDVDQINSGDYIVTGYSTQIYNPGVNADTTTDIFLLKLNSSGTLQWVKTFGQDDESEEGHSVRKTSDGGYIVAGHTSETSSGMSASDVFLWKFNSSDATVFQYSYKVGGFLSLDISFGYAAQPTADGGYALFGVTTGLGLSLSYFSNFMLKLDSSADTVFCRSYKDSVDGLPISMGYTIWNDGKQLADGGYLLGGCGFLSSGMGIGFKLIKTNSNGLSGCSENKIHPIRYAFAPAAESITPSNVATGSSDDVHTYETNPTVTVESICEGVPLVVEAGSNKTTCVGQGVTIGGSPTASGGSGSYSYTWAPSTYLNNVSVANPTCTPTSPTPATITYTVSVNDGSTTSNDVVTVTVNPLPSVTLSPLSNVCLSTPSFALTGGSPSGGNYSGTGVSGNTFYPATAGIGTHTITYTYSNGTCSNSASQTITVNGGVSGTISGGNSPICYNTNPGTFTATASGGTGVYTYQWYISPSTLISNATNSTYNPGSLTSSTGYYCTISSGACGSANTPTTTITVYPQLTATLSGGTSPICDKTNPGTFTATATGGTGTYTYQWYSTNTGLISGATNSTYNPGNLSFDEGFYCIVTSSPCGTATTLTFNVVVIPQVSNPTPITISAGTEPVCQLTNGTTTTTYSTTAANNTGFVWSIDNPAAGSINPATGVMTWANGFFGTVTIQVYATGCNLPSAQVIHEVTVSPSVGTPVFALGSSSTICQGAQSITYTATAANNTGLVYSIDAASQAGGNSINPSTGQVTYTDGWTGTTIITATASGCNGPVIAQHTAIINAVLAASVSISASPSGPACSGSLVTFTATALNPGTSPIYQWMINGSPVGGNSSTYSSSSLSMGNQVSCQLTSNLQCATGSPATSNTILMIVKPSLTAAVIIETPTNPVCSHDLVTFTATPENGGTTPAYQWYLNSNPVGGNSNTYSNLNLVTGDTISCVLTSNEACIVGNPVSSNEIIMVVSLAPTADAGTDATYTTTPIHIGSASNGPGIITWSPATGLDSVTSAHPHAFPTYTTVYTISVNNDGCVKTDDVIITTPAGSGYMVSGQTRYACKANTGNPVPNPPTYGSFIYNIDNVLVILKNLSGTELSCDTSDANGVFLFINIASGNYILSYDKLTSDTMQWANDANALDVAQIKYRIGSDSASNPSRYYATVYKKAADVNNDASVNALDVAKIKAKIGSPYDPAKNFKKGNWVNLDYPITVANNNVSVTLPIISYGDYNASSNQYRDSTTTWSQAKSLPLEGMIMTSEETMVTTNSKLIEVPLRISGKVNEFSALGLELTYQNEEYELLTASMPKAGKDNEEIKLNPTLDEIIADDNDLLVTENNGVIRVVYATTNHYDVVVNDLILTLVFKPLKVLQPGELTIDLQGTGVIADQYGREPEGVYLMMPKIYLQETQNAAEFDFTAYPNPFNDNLTLSYVLPEAGKVSIKVYNVLGELVQEFENKNQSAGKYSVDFPGKKLPNGMYTFKLDFIGLNKSNCAILKMMH